ncbi:MAG: hypothetical protein ACOCVM_05835 [Desulfovibrionaceae bacterium]
MLASAEECDIALSEKHLQIIKDLHNFSRLKRYHGLLPHKETLLYDPDVFQELRQAALVEKGTVFTSCGASLTGYRLSESARERLRDHGVEFPESPRRGEEAQAEMEDFLGPEHVDILVDVYHLSQTHKYGGIAPKEMLSDYEKKMVKMLYDAGFLFYIKLKGADVRRRKGYILSRRAARLLKDLDCLG